MQLRFFAEPALSVSMRCFAALSMTSEGLSMTEREGLSMTVGEGLAMTGVAAFSQLRGGRHRLVALAAKALRGSSADNVASSSYSSRSRGPTVFGAIRTRRT